MEGGAVLEDYKGLEYGGDDHAFRFVDVPPEVLDTALGEFDQRWREGRPRSRTVPSW